MQVKSRFAGFLSYTCCWSSALRSSFKTEEVCCEISSKRGAATLNSSFRGFLARQMAKIF